MFCKEQVAEFRGYVPRIRDAGAELVILGNGTPQQAAWFVEDYGIGVPVVVDPGRETYRIAGARRSLLPSPGTLIASARAFRRGHRQTKTMGDAAQLGGVFVITPAGEMAYAYRSRYAGDHPGPEAVVRVLEGMR